MGLISKKAAAPTPPADAPLASTEPPPYVPASGELAAMLKIAECMSKLEPALVVPHPLLVTKSMLQTWVGELRARLEARGYSLNLPPEWWRSLAGSCLATDLRERQILDDLGTIAAKMRAQDTPPAIVPPSTVQLELAKDLGVRLPESRDAAAALLAQALAKTAAMNPRAAAAWARFGAEPVSDAPSELAKTYRHALTGHGLPAVRRGSVFGDAPPRLQPPPAAEPFSALVDLAEWLKAFAPVFGMTPIGPYDAAVRAGKHESTYGRELEALQKQRNERSFDVAEADRKMLGEKQAHRSAYERRAAELQADENARSQAHIKRLAQEREQTRAKFIAIIDDRLAALEHAEYGSLRYLWCREARLALGSVPGVASTVKPLFGAANREHAMSALRWLRDAGLSFEVAP